MKLADLLNEGKITPEELAVKKSEKDASVKRNEEEKNIMLKYNSTDKDGKLTKWYNNDPKDQNNTEYEWKYVSNTITTPTYNKKTDTDEKSSFVVTILGVSASMEEFIHKIVGKSGVMTTLRADIDKYLSSTKDKNAQGLASFVSDVNDDLDNDVTVSIRKLK